ncbi:MAG: hypothetical protein IH986_09210 [Planctomycetes bacterium]|nr:hypothetical protein [Planctomycetota bacterium]
MTRHLDAELAHRFIKGRLDPDERRACVTHLSTCAECRGLVDEERGLSNLLKLSDDPRHPEGAIERVLERLAAVAPQRAAQRRRQHRIAWVGYIATTVVVVLSAWSLTALSRETERVAADLGISPTIQRQVLKNLDALDTLRSDAWLADHYTTAITLDALLTNRGRNP